MLRSGYSSDAVMRELATRHFADTFDSTVEEQLKRAGASESLLNALRTGSYAATVSEISAAKEKAIARQKPTQPQAPPLQKPKSSQSAGTPSPVSDPPNAIYELLQRNLVHLERGELRKLDDELVVRKKNFYLSFLTRFEFIRTGRALVTVPPGELLPSRGVFAPGVRDHLLQPGSNRFRNGELHPPGGDALAGHGLRQNCQQGWPVAGSSTKCLTWFLSPETGESCILPPGPKIATWTKSSPISTRSSRPAAPMLPLRRPWR